MRKISSENTDRSCTDDNAGLRTLSSPGTFRFEQEAQTFAEYNQQVSICLFI